MLTLKWCCVEREGLGHVKTRREFLLPEYGVFILPKNDTCIAFSTSTIFHCTNVANGYDVIGMSYSTKENVKKLSTSKSENILSTLRKTIN